MEKIEIGKIINTRGLDGTMKVMPISGEESFKNLKNAYINNSEYTVVKTSSSKGFVYLKTKEITDINTAEILKNSYIFANKEDLHLNENEYFICDILGCEIFDENNTFIGVVEDIDNFGAQDIYTLKNNKKELTFCLIDNLFISVDIVNKKIIVNSKILSEVLV